MIQVQLKLKPPRKQEARLNEWLPTLAAVWNWAIRKIEQDAADGIHYSRISFLALLKGHGSKIGIPNHVLRGVQLTALEAWARCFKGIARKPRLKGGRNKLNSILFPDPIPLKDNRVTILGIGNVQFFKQEIPAGKIKRGRVLKRASGWYVSLSIDAAPRPVVAIRNGCVGIDPGFKNLLTLSTGETINHPRELNAASIRLSQAQRGGNKKLVARLHERIAMRRRSRNHNLSRQLVSENQLIAFSADRHHLIAKRFGKSVADSAHLQLRRMLSYKSKCRTDGLGVYVEVDSRNSTKTCSACGALSGPTGLAGLKVRQWTCAQCGAEHDRDVNAAINTLIAGAGLAHEMSARAV